MKALGVCVLVVALAGCTSWPSNPANMSAEQLKEWVKDRNANVSCAIINSPYGKGSLLMLTLDKGIVLNGTLTVDDACKVQMVNQQNPPKVVPP